MEQHHIYIENQEVLTVSQVTDVEAFDEESLWANLVEGDLEIRGQGLHIEKLNLEEGVMIVKGKIEAIQYIEQGKDATKGIRKLFQRKQGK